VTRWHEDTLGHIADAAGGFIRTGPFGSQLHRHEYVEDGPVAVVMPKDMIGGRIAPDSIARISDKTASRLSVHRLQPGDIVLARRGDIGRAAWVDAQDGEALCGTGSMRIHLPAGDLIPRFLHYFLQTRAAAGWLRGQAVGATMPNLNDAIVRALPVRYPPKKVQRQIVEVLDAIYDLIENNRRRIALLEQMAQAIYRAWFVHFRYPGHDDDELVDSSRGPVPSRFEVAPLGACCNINREQRRPEPDEEIVYIDISALGDRTVALPTPIRGSDAPGRARRVLSDGDIVWSMVRPGRRAHALLVKAQANWIGSTGLAVISPNGVPPSFVFESVSTSTFSDYLVGKEQGAAYPAVRPIDFDQAQIMVPPEDVLRAFDDVASPIHGLGWELAAQARAATQLHDLLLPKLVTGAIDVSKLDLDGLLEESAA
jgi:type I restriction enzyme, S subunit